ncbi:Hypp3949 [Branchiostoma lanceolatum]|uniref:Hypp3949 protein n=1 Tax=Branchiostoma lanceolatum TaxID=7740 RepID=A0A8K0A779_BRALA|nr:Hypp3949 [Branchiostoma lanceolatum]
MCSLTTAQVLLPVQLVAVNYKEKPPHKYKARAHWTAAAGAGGLVGRDRHPSARKDPRAVTVVGSLAAIMVLLVNTGLLLTVSRPSAWHTGAACQSQPRRQADNKPAANHSRGDRLTANHSRGDRLTANHSRGDRLKTNLRPQT